MRNCGNCIYCDLLITEEPCMDCLYNSNWGGEADNESDRTDRTAEDSACC